MHKRTGLPHACSSAFARVTVSITSCTLCVGAGHLLVFPLHTAAPHVRCSPVCQQSFPTFCSQSYRPCGRHAGTAGVPSLRRISGGAMRGTSRRNSGGQNGGVGRKAVLRNKEARTDMCLTGPGSFVRARHAGIGASLSQ